VLSDWQITNPAMGTARTTRPPYVVLTSNNSRELSEALKRRCLYLFLDYPSPERERAIVQERVPQISEALGKQLVAVVNSIRDLELKKAPSIAETIDWAQTLLHLGAETLDQATLRRTMSVVLKFQSDIERARHHLIGMVSR
jgi:MoxR-like ATPase